MNDKNLRTNDSSASDLIPISDTVAKHRSPSTKAEQPKSVWQKTPYANLVRYVPSGTLFARIKMRGKLIRQSLETSDLQLAKRKLDELAASEARATEDRRNAKLTFAEGLEEFRTRGYRVGIHGKSSKRKPLKPRTRMYYEERIAALLKSWPELAEMPLKKLSQRDCEQWADRFGQAASPSVYNHTISILRQIVHIGVESGARYDNPALALGRMGDRPKKLQLPEPEQFRQFIRAIETAGSGFSKGCADLVQFLAYGGFRKSEAANILWENIDLNRGVITVFGDPETRTKNGQFRAVPVIPDMRALLERLQNDRPDAQKTDPVMQVRECQRAMDSAAKKVGMPRITHHDLRHLFATRCIESGVDIPTVSRWLGHRDGGALAMKVYGHLRDHHSANMAQKVTFSTGQAVVAKNPRDKEAA
ncbi:MAG TPA: site-specific integrase [Verrucomicrobiae bacterium]|nr:site-specific integrase [Verrucomicrobiae bacterium]